MSSIFADPVSWTTEHRAQAHDGKDRTILHAPIRATNGRVGARSPPPKGIGAGVRAFPTPEHPAGVRRWKPREPCASRSSALLSLMVVLGSACRLRLPIRGQIRPLTRSLARRRLGRAGFRWEPTGNPRVLGSLEMASNVRALREALHTRRDRRQIQYRCVFLMLGTTFQQPERHSTPLCERFANGVARLRRSAMAVAASSRACHAEQHCT